VVRNDTNSVRGKARRNAVLRRFLSDAQHDPACPWTLQSFAAEALLEYSLPTVAVESALYTDMPAGVYERVRYATRFKQNAAREEIERSGVPKPTMAIHSLHVNRKGNTFLLYGLRDRKGRIIYAYCTVVHRTHKHDLQTNPDARDIMAIELVNDKSLSTTSELLASLYLKTGPAVSYRSGSVPMNPGNQAFMNSTMIAGLRLAADMGLPLPLKAIVEAFLAERDEIHRYDENNFRLLLGEQLAPRDDDFGGVVEIDTSSSTLDEKALEKIIQHRGAEHCEARMAHLRHVHAYLGNAKYWVKDPFELPTPAAYHDH
jgi:hypothetical protein